MCSNECEIGRRWYLTRPFLCFIYEGTWNGLASFAIFAWGPQHMYIVFAVARVPISSMPLQGCLPKLGVWVNDSVYLYYFVVWVGQERPETVLNATSAVKDFGGCIPR